LPETIMGLWLRRTLLQLPCVHKYKWNTDDTDGTDKTDFYILRSSIIRVYPVTWLGLLDMFRILRKQHCENPSHLCHPCSIILHKKMCTHGSSFAIGYSMGFLAKRIRCVGRGWPRIFSNIFFSSP